LREEIQMARPESTSSHSTLEELPTEKHDPLLEHMKNSDAYGAGLHWQNTANSDLEAGPMGRPLTRADTAAYVTKHPSRIPDEGTMILLDLADCSNAEKGGDLHC
jgi:hypothetical protein